MENVSSRCGKSDNAPRLRFPEFRGEWVEKKLREIIIEVKRKAEENSKAPVMMISATEGFINQSERYSSNNAGKSLKKYTLLKKGELAYNHGYSKTRNFGSCFTLEIEQARIPFVYHSFSLKGENDSVFWGKYLNSGLFDGKLRRLVASTARMDGLLNISFENYSSMPVNIPSLPEQKKIAAFFTLLDRRIQKQRQLVEFLKTYKRGVLQSVFSKNYRWEELSIEDIFSCIIDKNHPDKTVLTIVQGTGTLPRNSIDRKISYNAESVSSYKKVKENDFILHLRSFEGGLEIANEEGIVSPAYTILRATKNISPLFYYNYFRSYNFINEKLRIAVEGIRDGKSINMNTFWKIKVPFPPYELQNYYASFFSLIDQNIKKNESLLQALEKGKRQLLQKMFI